jgi:hypothetical protein
LGDLLDEPLLVSGDAPGAAARSGRRRSVRPRSCPASAALVRCLWLQFAERMIRRPASMRHLHVLPCTQATTLQREHTRLSHYAAAEAQALCTAVICSRVG